MISHSTSSCPQKSALAGRCSRRRLSRLAQDIGSQGATRYEYDANGNLTKVTDPLNQVTQNAYDPLNRLIQVTDPGQAQTRYGWDGQDRLSQVTDPRNLATTYTIDGLGNRTAQQSPDTGNSSATYDAAGNELTRTDAKGQKTSTTYDALNRPTQIIYADGSKVLYTWDTGSNGKGRLARIDEQNASGTLQARLQYTYDPLGRVTGETRTLGSLTHNTAYTYSGGQLSSQTLPSGRKLSYTRNAGGQVTQIDVTANGQTRTLISNTRYQPFGSVKHYADGSGRSHDQGQDPDGRTTSYTLGGQTWLLNYDAASRIIGQIDGSNAANSGTYGYDPQDHLKSASLPATTYGYTYDASGNRTSQSVGGNTRSYTTAANSNRLQSLSNPSQNLTHDANGSITVDGSNQYAYDARGRLSQATTAAGITQYQINGLGQRIKKSNSAGDIRYHYDHGGRLIAESNGTGTIQREYVWLDDQPVAVLQ